MSTANPTRKQVQAQSSDPLVAAAQQKVDEAKQKLEELQATTKAARKETEQNDAALDLLRQATALQEAEVAYRNGELVATRDEAQQQIDRINAALGGTNDEPEPATPDEPAETPQPIVVDHPADEQLPPDADDSSTSVKDLMTDEPAPARKTFRQRFQDFRSRLA